MKRGIRLGIIGCIAALVCISGAMRVQYVITGMKDDTWSGERLSYLPSSEAVEPYLLGFSETFANYLWIRTMLYFGGHLETDKEFPRLVHMVDMVTKLNPRFYPAYEFAALMLPNSADALDAARIILSRGITHLGHTTWKLHYYMGFLYFEYYHDRERAAEFFQMASHHPDVPPYLPALAARLYADSGQRETGVFLLKSIYETAENPQVKERVLQKLREMGEVDTVQSSAEAGES